MNEDDLKLTMLDSFIRLMDQARLQGDTKKMENFARLVHECWAEILEDEENDNE